MKTHISFSEAKIYSECQYRWHLEYEKGFKNPSNIHSEFGSLIHRAIEQRLKEKKNCSWISFGKNLKKWIKKNPIDKKIDGTEEILNYKEWIKQGFVIYHQMFDWLDKTFPEYEFVDSEMRLEESINNELKDFKFKGFIDLVIKDKNGIYNLCDWKTTAWGWNLEKRSDTIKQYQLTLYKKYFCDKMNIDPKLVKTHFILLKRMPGKKEAVELLTITSGNKKVENASNWLQENIKRIQKGFKMKNKNSCKYCPHLGKECKI